jgi:hypothetical protein
MSRDANRSYTYEPGVIRKMKKSGKYTLNSDVFETKSRPVSVASVHELDLEDNPAIVVDENTDSDKAEKFDNLHKPVLFLKSCPSPATFLHKKNLPPPSPTSLLGKLSLLDSIINDINETRIQDNVCVMCGREHHVTEQCLHSDGFEDSDTEVHCNPAFSAPKDQNVDKKAGGKRKKKKRRKVLKFDQSDDSSDTG